MSEDLTKKLPGSENDVLRLILTVVQNLEGRFNKLDVRVSDVDSRLGHLKQTVEERLYDTRPIWEKVLAELDKVQQGQMKLEQTLLAETGAIKNSLIDLYSGQNALNAAALKIQQNFHHLDGRVHEIELTRNTPKSTT